MKGNPISKITLNEENYDTLVFENYTNTLMISDEEIQEDLTRIKFIRRLIKNYFTKGVINGRLITNHIVILNNVFETSFMVELLFYHMEDYNMRVVLKTFLLFLGYVKETFEPDIGVDYVVANKLRSM